MSSLKQWLPKNVLDLFSLPVSWREVVGVLSLGFVGRLLWQQYGVLRWPNLPPHDLGLPLVGHTLRMMRESLAMMDLKFMEGKSMMLLNYLGANVVIVDWPLYLERLHRLELDGAMVPAAPPTAKKILGPNSILSLPGGKGHPRHKRLRNKILASLGPKAVLGLLPDMIDLARRRLDTMVAETESRGSSSFEIHAATLASEVSMLPITAGLETDIQKEVSALVDDIGASIVCLPINLGRFTRCGRGLLARQRLGDIVRALMKSPNLSRRSIIRDLTEASEDGEGFQPEEMVDTVVTLLLAGKLTTAEGLQTLLAHLHEHRDWVQRIAEEPLSFQGCEDASATLCFVRETLRVKPPASAFRRSLIDSSQAIDLGEHGTIPPGTTFSVWFFRELTGMAGDFNPERWTAEVAAREGSLMFGGHQPHQCIGKNLALMELQVLARVLCAEYEFEALDTSPAVKPPFFVPGYKDGLKVKIARRKP